MTKNNFSQKQIKLIEDKICKKHKLTFKYVMSTSGEFFVRMYTNGKNNFLLKIRQINKPGNQQRFLKEIKINEFIYKNNFSHLRTTKYLEFNLKNKPEYLFYELIPGIPLNSWYFYTGARQEKNIINSHLFKTIQTIQTNVPKQIFSFEKFYFKKNYEFFLKYEKTLKKYLKNKDLKRVRNILNNNKKYLNNCELVVTHGDLNPKNIIFYKNKPAIIDWSDAHLNNPLFDLCTLYMYSWNIPKVEYKIKKFINTNYEYVENADKLYLINRLILTPKIIKITEDSIKGLNKDRKNKLILAKTKKELTKKAKEAITTHLNSLMRIVEHFELWERPMPILKSMDKFCNTIFIKDFLHQEKNKLNINFDWDTLSVKRLRLAIRSGDQKLISQYTIKNKNGRKKIIMLKIRMERGDDLAKQSFDVLKNIWKNKKTKHIISQPLNYYKKYNAYLYEKTIGDSIAQLIEEKKITKILLKKYIKQAGKIMADLHNINPDNFKNINFIDNYSLVEQLKWFKYYLNKIPQLNTKKNHTLPKKINKLIDKYLSNNQKTFIHGDFQLQNLITNNQKIKLIDFDNVDINDPLLDVGNFLNQLNYKGLLKGIDILRKIFLDSYLKNNNNLDKNNFNERLNIYIIMGIIKNINYNCLEMDYDIARIDIKKIFFILEKISQNPLNNLSGIKKFIHK